MNEVIPMDFWESLGKYVYAYITPEGENLYVGKGNRSRAKTHINSKNYDIDNLYIVARNLEQFDGKKDAVSFLLESYNITRLKPTDNLVSGHYKEYFEMQPQKFSELFKVYKSEQIDNFEALPDWYTESYEKFKGRITVLEFRSDVVKIDGNTLAQIQPIFSVSSSGEVKSFKFNNSAKDDKKLELRTNQIYQFLEAQGIRADEIEPESGKRESFAIKKSLTIEEAISIFDNFMS